MSLPRHCHVFVMSLQCHCLVFVMSLPCHCHVIVMGSLDDNFLKQRHIGRTEPCPEDIRSFPKRYLSNFWQKGKYFCIYAEICFYSDANWNRQKIQGTVRKSWIENLQMKFWVLLFRLNIRNAYNSLSGPFYLSYDQQLFTSSPEICLSCIVGRRWNDGRWWYFHLEYLDI